MSASTARPLHWLLAVAFGLMASLAQADNATLVAKYKRIFSNEPPVNQIEAARQLEWLGLSDTGVFDIVEQNLLRSYQDPVKERADYASWMAKSLGFSGQAKYTETLNTVAKSAVHKNTKRHASQAIDNLPRYAELNKIISQPQRAGVDPEINGFINMLRSNNLDLKRIAAKRVYHARLRDSTLLAELEKSAKAGYTGPIADKNEADAVAWQLQALASTSSEKYRPLLQDAAANATDARVRKYASGYLAKFYL